MPSMIDRLIGETVVRKDDHLILPIKRPLPERPRDLLEILSALGGEASWQSLRRSVMLVKATPAWLTFVALNRWPTLEELRSHPDKYSAGSHLHSLIHGIEFRTLLAQRILTSYPEKVRLLYVRIPHCAGQHFMAAMRTMHPIFPEEIASPELAKPAAYLPTLGRMLGRFIHTRTVLLSLPRLAPFFKPPRVSSGASGASPTDDLLPWTISFPPYRTGDRLFTIVREPADIILGRVNAIARALQHPVGDDVPDVARWRKRLGALPAADEAPAWTGIARKILAKFAMHDPICHALGDGTCAGALDACAITNIEIADVSRYPEWILRTWDTKPEPPEPQPIPILAREDLIESDLARLAALTEQDRPLYARIKNALAGAELSSIKGSQL